MRRRKKRKKPANKNGREKFKWKRMPVVWFMVNATNSELLAHFRSKLSTLDGSNLNEASTGQTKDKLDLHGNIQFSSFDKKT